MLRYLLGALAACLIVLAAGAEEKINRFDVGIEVRQNGDILVTETINVAGMHGARAGAPLRPGGRGVGRP